MMRSVLTDWRRHSRAISLVAAAVASAVAIGACGGSSSTSSNNNEPSKRTGKALNMHVVIGSIEESFLKKRGIHAKVACPVSVEQSKGHNFTCEATGTTAGHPPKPFRVRVAVMQVNNNGYVEYVSY
jgi:hypothetical protein